MALSEKQKVRARWVNRGKKVSVILSLWLVGWSVYALVNFKPVDVDGPLRKATTAATASDDTKMAKLEATGSNAQLQKPSASLDTASLVKTE